jgi:hypothetical protein
VIRWMIVKKVLGVTTLWGWPCLAAKPSWGSYGRLACPLLWPRAHHRSDEGTGLPTGLCLVPSRKSERWHFREGGGDTRPPTLDACGMLTTWVPVSQVFA